VKRRVLQVVLYKRFTFCSEVLTFADSADNSVEAPFVSACHTNMED
jgi:hypothetical protein